ncbi:hypothetical protein [Streptomyces sp. NPDC018031]|uniref:hypothetical protein n=1 Tax=Streptomyces sp. NPDC018031 TaxID=3365033 RepID=UPI003794AE47
MTLRRRPGWAVYIEDTPASIILDMPRDLAKAVTNYVAALALEAGGAHDAGRDLPGEPMDHTGLRRGLRIEGEPVLVEYTVRPDIRAVQVCVLVWYS